ncbi:protein kinase domain-containing protein [Stieleria marina]
MTRLQKLSQQQLDEIAEAFSSAIRRDKQPSVDDFVAQYCADGIADESAQELHSLLSSIAMIERLKQTPAEPVDAAKEIRQLDDYTVVREIGRGGMGVVFEAIHQSLGRRVAIKVLSHALLNQPKHLARFRREARAAARLRHTNIVPVFGVGEDQSQHYYVMDFIRGLSLREWLESLSGSRGRVLPTQAESISETDTDLEVDTTVFASDATTADPMEEEASNQLSVSIPTDTDSQKYFRWVAQVGATVADALQYAHSQGILHRDIKPANLLLDQDGRVWIADFGLAKLTEQDATMTGDIVGTPQYMAPESFENVYDESSETYCLGLTLYELLTGHVAIDGKNTSDTIRRATQGVTVNPRKWNRRIPRDLETIIVKSVALDSSARYATASEMRDDLQRFLADRPIAARRTGPAERLIRWSRREPTVAALTLGIFASLLTLAIVAGVAYWKTNQALVDTQVAKNSAVSAARVAQEQRLLAQSNLQVAVKAFDEISQRIVDRSDELDADLLGDIADSTSPAVSQQDAQLLQSLLLFFDELAKNNRDNVELKLQAAAAMKRVGDIHHRLGQHTQADKAFQEAWIQYNEIASASLTVPDDLQQNLLLTQVTIMNDRASIAGLRGNVSQAVDLYDRTIDLLNESSNLLESTEGRFEYARANSLFSSIATRSGLDVAASFKSRGRRPVHRFFGNKDAPSFRQELYASNEAIQALTSLTNDAPDDLRFQMALSRALRQRAEASLSDDRPLGDRLKQPRLMAGVRKDVSQSTDILDRLRELHPDNVSIQYELSKTLSVIAFQLGGEDARYSQRGRLVKSKRIADELLAQSPDTPRYLALKAHSLGQMAKARRMQGQSDEELSLLREQLEIQKRLLKGAPELSQYQIKLAQTIERLAEVHLAKGQRKEAVQYLRQATDSLSEVVNSPVAAAKLMQLNRKLGGLKRDPRPR